VPVGDVGYDLQEGGFTAAQVAAALRAAPLAASAGEIAQSLTTFYDTDTESALQSVTGSLLGAVQAMIDAGFGAVRSGEVLASLGAGPGARSTTTFIGYSYGDVGAALNQVFPFDPQQFMEAFASGGGGL